MREALVIGIGCTRGTPCAALAIAVDDVLAQHALTPEAVCTLASIETKRDEAGLLALARTRGWALSFHAAAALAAIAREQPCTQPSEAARRRVGTPAVAEPAARLASGHGPLRVPKTIRAIAGHAITIAVAARRGGSAGG